MPSAIDATKPVDNAPALTSDLRANLLTAKNEITALQASVAAAGDFKSDGTVAMTGAIATTVGTMTSSVANGASAKAFSFNTSVAYTTTAKLASWANNGTEKAFIQQDGKIHATGTSTSSLAYGFTSNASAGIFNYAGGNFIGFGVNGGFTHLFDAYRTMLHSSTVLSWATSGNPDGSLTVGLAMNAANRLEVNTSTAGTFADLKLRNLIATGNLALGIVAKTANYTVTANDHTIECDATSGAITLTLPAVSGAQAGTQYTLKKTDASANAVTFDGNASETIDGATTVSTTTQWASITIRRNAAGTAWITTKD